MGKQQMLLKSTKTRRDVSKNNRQKMVIVFKLPFHPRGITRQQITHAYHVSGLAQLQTDRRFICSQLRPYNIRDRICAGRLKDIQDANPSKYLSNS